MITTELISQQEDIRKLPDGWCWVKLGDVAQLERGKFTPRPRNDPRYYGGSYPWIQTGEVEAAKKYITTYRNTLNKQGLEVSKLFPKGTLVITIAATIGAVGILTFDSCMPDSLVGITPLEGVSDTEFLYYLLLFVRSHLKSIAPQVAQANLKLSLLEPLEIPLPPLDEQKRIAAILNEQMEAVERSRQATLAQIEAAQALPAAYLRAVFNSPDAQKWERKRIGEGAKLQSGYAFKSEWFVEEGIRLLRNANVSQGFISWDDAVYLPLSQRSEFKTYELFVGDIILSLDRPVVSNGLKIARLSENDVPSLLLQRVGRFQLGYGIDPGYLYAFLNSTKFITAITKHDQSLGVPHISPGQVEAIEFPVPPLPEQQRIAANLTKQLAEVERLKQSLKSQLDAINKLPATLLRRAFNGEL